MGSQFASQPSHVVLCAANNWDDVRLSDRPLAEALAEHRSVLYVDPPLSRLASRHNPRLRKALQGPRLRQVAPSISRLTPVVMPFPFRGPMVPLTRRLVRRTLSTALHNRQVSAIVSTWLDVDVFDLAPKALHCYWAQDDVATGAALWGLDPKRLVARERQVAESADVVLLANPGAVADWRGGGTVTAFPNGCDVTRFESTPQSPVRLELPAGKPVAGFVGQLNQRTDLDLLEAVVDRGASLLLVGPISPDLEPQRVLRLLARDGVKAVGAQPFEDLPSWLGAMDVGLVPYRNDEFNRWSFPLKTLEYLAAGLPVVSTALPASRWLNSPDVTMADEVDAFARAVLACSEERHSPGAVARRRAFATSHSWQVRAQELVSLLEG